MLRAPRGRRRYRWWQRHHADADAPVGAEPQRTDGQASSALALIEIRLAKPPLTCSFEPRTARQSC
jgi:hypothetical protein